MELNDQPLPVWAVTPAKVTAAVQRLVETARPRKLFLFGSNATGTGGSDSDLDVLVVTDDSVQNPREESVRLRRALRGILMPVDILVVNESFFDAHRDTPGLIYREVLATGRLVYDAALLQAIGQPLFTPRRVTPERAKALDAAGGARRERVQTGQCS